MSLDKNLWVREKYEYMSSDKNLWVRKIWEYETEKAWIRWEYISDKRCGFEKKKQKVWILVETFQFKTGKVKVNSKVQTETTKRKDIFVQKKILLDKKKCYNFLGLKKFCQ